MAKKPFLLTVDSAEIASMDLRYCDEAENHENEMQIIEKKLSRYQFHRNALEQRRIKPLSSDGPSQNDHSPGPPSAHISPQPRILMPWQIPPHMTMNPGLSIRKEHRKSMMMRDEIELVHIILGQVGMKGPSSRSQKR